MKRAATRPRVGAGRLRVLLVEDSADYAHLVQEAGISIE